jgi:hypothetical protein
MGCFQYVLCGDVNRPKKTQTHMQRYKGGRNKDIKGTKIRRKETKGNKENKELRSEDLPPQCIHLTQLTVYALVYEARLIRPQHGACTNWLYQWSKYSCFGYITANGMFDTKLTCLFHADNIFGTNDCIIII